MRLFRWLNIETSSLCNRRCPACIRNSNPDREAVKPWFSQNLMPMEMLKGILDQAAELDFRGRVCLVHYNEPLLDPRFVDIVRLARSYNRFWVYFVTNGDYLTPELAKELDPLLDRIVISLYVFEQPDRHIKATYFKSMFRHSQVIIKGQQVATHFSWDAYRLAVARREAGCSSVMRRAIVNHQRKYLMCCDDMLGSFDLGSFPETSLKDYWFGEKHRKLMEDMDRMGGRKKHEYCISCPK